MRTKTAHLFSPVSSSTLALPNRLAVAPMTRVTATAEGVPTETMARYYMRFATGGFGLVITEGNYIDRAFSQTYEYQPGLADEAQARGWQPIVESIHHVGAKIIAQIQHSGALCQGNPHAKESVAPSAIQPKGEQMTFYRGQGPYRTPRELTDEEISDVIASFAATAVRATQIAGFDGVEIHGANGYLLDEFLTDYTNQRKDAWGGNVTNRIRLAVEVVKAVRAAVGEATPVGIRISQGKVNDFFHKWAEKEDGASVIFGSLADAGVDYIHVTEFEAWRPAFDEKGPTLVQLARRYARNTLLIANGGLHYPAMAERVLEDGADVIALGRSALSNPNWPNRVREGLALVEFDQTILSPIADIKNWEFAL